RRARSIRRADAASARVARSRKACAQPSNPSSPPRANPILRPVTRRHPAPATARPLPEDDPVISTKIPPDATQDAAAVALSPLVDVRDLTVRLVSRDMDVTLLHGMSFTLQQGDVLCLVGESGSGKSVTLRSLMRLLPPTARIGGGVRIGGVDIQALK